MTDHKYDDDAKKATKREDEDAAAKKAAKRREDGDDDVDAREGEAPENWVDPTGPDLTIPENQPYNPEDFPDAPEAGVDPRVPQSNPINE